MHLYLHVEAASAYEQRGVPGLLSPLRSTYTMKLFEKKPHKPYFYRGFGRAS
jgi:hypothetical protein